MPITSRYQNPYAALGSSAAGIVDSFMNRGGIESSGYLNASKAMADIDSTRAGTGKTKVETDKILQELARSRSADSMTAEDFNAMKSGDFGTQMQGSIQAGNGTQSFKDIIAQFAPPEGGAVASELQTAIPGFDMSMMKDTVPIGLRGTYVTSMMDQTGLDNFSPAMRQHYKALKAAIAKGDELKASSILSYMGQQVMAGLEGALEPDPLKAAQISANRFNANKAAFRGAPQPSAPSADPLGLFK